MAFPNYVYLKQPLRRISDYPSSNPHHKNSSGAKPFVSKFVPYSIFAPNPRHIRYLRYIRANMHLCATSALSSRHKKTAPQRGCFFACFIPVTGEMIYPASDYLSTSVRKSRPALPFCRKAGIRLRCRSGQTECSGWSGAFL